LGEANNPSCIYVCFTLIKMASNLEVGEKIESFFTITRIYSSQDGESHFGTVKIKMKGKGDIGSISDIIPSTGLMFRETPSSYNYSWHTAPRRQFIVNLDASVQVTVSSGEKRILKEGEVFFVEDTTALPTLVGMWIES
uniref:Uncharacterized protein n=1 Tax=Amphimedon queenslandica TaxID=400682 RepID=A0A1X7UXY6_AMPQE